MELKSPLARQLSTVLSLTIQVSIPIFYKCFKDFKVERQCKSCWAITKFLEDILINQATDPRQINQIRTEVQF